MEVTFVALGGALDKTGRRPPIGGSLYLLRAGDVGVVFDAGLYPQLDQLNRDSVADWDYITVDGARAPVLSKIDLGVPGDDDFILSTPQRSQLPRFDLLYQLKRIVFVLTHGHLDHCGAIPYLLNRFPRANVFMTRQTQAIAQWVWRDTLRLANREGKEPLYRESEIRHTLEATIPITENQSVEVGPFSFLFFSSGHILGAVGCLVQISRPGRRPLRVFVTGDMNTQCQHTVQEAVFPENLTDIDCLISESTNGNSASFPRSTVEKSLVEEVEQCMSRKGKVILGALSIGRAQEVYSILRDNGVTNRHRVYIDGAAREISKVYKQWVSRLSDVDAHFVSDNPSERDNLVKGDEPLIMIAPSGMYTGGWSSWYAEEWSKDRNNLIGITSYQDPCSAGYRMLRDGERRINARVKEFRLSAHMSGADILKVIDIISPSEVFLVHGEARSMEAIKQKSSVPCQPTYIGESYSL